MKKPLIDQAFGEASVLQILQKLDKMAKGDGADQAWAQKTAATMRTKSPTSLEIAFRQLRQGKSLSMRRCMQLEYRIVSRVLSGVEFYEGIRAAIIDKDGAPLWQPATLEAVDQNTIGTIFAKLTGQSGTLQGELLFK
jgi:enoyl-CoA hydratase